jgi:large subunit ribosomal protein L23
MRIDSIIIKPVLTEKSSRLVQTNVYTFHVHSHANKHQIAAVIKKMYAVEVGEIKVLNRKGKVKKVGRKQVSKKQPTEKIAYVTVKKGTINVFPKA